MAKCRLACLSILLIMASFIFMLPKTAEACGCIHPENASEAFEQASAVFAGELVIAKGERKQEGMTGPIENGRSTSSKWRRHGKAWSTLR